MELMKGFVFEDDEWVDGTVYDAETGKTYYGSMELENSNTLNLRGSLDSFGLIGRTETWTRVNERGNEWKTRQVLDTCRAVHDGKHQKYDAKGRDFVAQSILRIARYIVSFYESSIFID